MIREIIVVEGRDDEAAVHRAVEAETVATHGYGISQKTLERLETAYREKGLIIFTDPDHAGEGIRRRLTALFPGAKQAYLTRAEARKAGDLGIENACPEAIQRALQSARCSEETETAEFTPEDLDRFSLRGGPGAADRRERLGKALGIGYGNSKAFLQRLNHYGIHREEFLAHGNALFPPGDLTDQ